jgi:hypothetical protein
MPAYGATTANSCTLVGSRPGIANLAKPPILRLPNQVYLHFVNMVKFSRSAGSPVGKLSLLFENLALRSTVT